MKRSKKKLMRGTKAGKKSTQAVYVFTRKILRNVFRKKYGNNGLWGAWYRFQHENRGKSKNFTVMKIKGEILAEIEGRKA